MLLPILQLILLLLLLYSYADALAAAVFNTTHSSSSNNKEGLRFTGSFHTGVDHCPSTCQHYYDEWNSSVPLGPVCHDYN